jgi:hypothetical protein
MKKLKFIFVLILLSIGSNIYSQSQAYGIPTSFLYPDIYTKGFLQTLKAHALPDLDNATLQDYANSVGEGCAACGYDNYYGYGIQSETDVLASAQYHNDDINGGKLWIFKVSSPTALGLQFHFENFNIPEGAFLHIYTANRQIIFGPYSNIDNSNFFSQSNRFGTMPIFAGEVFLEYFESNSASSSGTLQLSNIIHVFNNSVSHLASGESALCQRDVMCDPPALEEKNSVAMVLGYNSTTQLALSCSGVLVNNTNQDGHPYFLTGAHCVGTETDLSTWQFIFDRERPQCGGIEPTPWKIITGATILTKDNVDGCSTPEKNDYCLLDLNVTAAEIATFGLCYAGWTVDDALASSYTYNMQIVHHPMGDLKKISRAEDLAAPSSDVPSSCSSYSLDADNYLHVDIQSGGAPEPGSSGAPLFNAHRQIIGLVYGASQTDPDIEIDACNPATYDLYFGRFRKQWPYVKSYLDPSETIDENGSPFYYTEYCTPQTSGPPPTLTYQQLEEGLIINGMMESVPVICQTNQITITPAVADRFVGFSIFEERTECSTIDLQEDPCYRKWWMYGNFFVCFCRYYTYNVSIQELDNDFNPVGQVYSKNYKFRSNGNAYSAEYGGSISLSQVTFNVSDLGISLTPGKFYRIGLAGIWHNAYHSSNKDIYILPSNLNVNNSTIGANLYAMDEITLENVVVNGDPNVAASNQITILPEAQLNGGRYFIQYIDCNTFGRLMNPGPTKSYTSTSPAPVLKDPKVISNQSGWPETENQIILYPNPHAGSFEIKSKKTLHHINARIFDLLGKVVYEKSYAVFDNEQINVQDLSGGVYYIDLSNAEGFHETHKLIRE